MMSGFLNTTVRAAELHATRQTKNKKIMPNTNKYNYFTPVMI